MPDIFLLDPSYNTIGILNESYSDLELIEKYQGVDSFKMVMSSQALYADEITNGRFLYLPTEDNALFLIEQIQEDVEEGKDEKVVAGRSVDGFALVERRVDATGIDYDSVTSTPAETAIKHYVNAHAGPGAEIHRRIPGLVIAPDLARGDTITTSARFGTLLSVLQEIGQVTGIGWKTTFDAALEQIVFDIIQGTDRSATVFFDFDFETLRAWSRLDSIADSKTLAIVAGQGELAARDIVKRYVGATEPSGFDRREDFVDARDVALGATAILEVRGDAYLVTKSPERALEATINEQGSFKLGVHWFNGDIVTIRNEDRGLEYTARVIEVHRHWSQSGTPETKSVLDRPIPKWKEQIEKVATGTVPVVDMKSAGGGGGPGYLIVTAGDDRIVTYGGGVGMVITT